MMPIARPGVVLVLPSFASGGAERVSLSLIAGLAPEAGTVVVFNRQGPLRSLLPTGMHVHDIDRPRLRRAWPVLLRWLRESRPGVVFSTFGHVNLALLAMRPFLPSGTRLVIRESSTPSLALRRGRAPAPALTRRAYRLLYPTADLVLCQHRAMADEMSARFGVPAGRVAFLPNPVDSARLRAGAPRRETGPGRRFVAAGRLTHVKGFDRLIDMVAGGESDDRLCVLGEGPDRAALEARSRALGAADRIRFAGFDPSPWRFYAGADAMLVSSRWEGLPNVALEALACGTPVIATPESGGIAEVAAAAPAGAVTVAEWGEPFRAALERVVASPRAEARPSLLPESYERDRVIAQFRSLIGVS